MTRGSHRDADFTRGRCLRIHLCGERLVERDASVGLVRLDAQRMVLLLHQSPHETANSEPCKQARKRASERTARKRRGRLPSASLVSVPWFRVWHRRPSCKKRRPQRWTTAPHRRVYVQALAGGLARQAGGRVLKQSQRALELRDVRIHTVPVHSRLEYCPSRRGLPIPQRSTRHILPQWHDTRPQAQMQQRAWCEREGDCGTAQY